jgi:hypothetical protein
VTTNTAVNIAVKHFETKDHSYHISQTNIRNVVFAVTYFHLKKFLKHMQKQCIRKFNLNTQLKGNLVLRTIRTKSTSKILYTLEQIRRKNSEIIKIRKKK